MGQSAGTGLCCAPVSATLSFGARLVLAFSCFFRVLFDGALAHQVRRLLDGANLLPAPTDEGAPKSVEKPKKAQPPSVVPALQLLSLLQREGRLIDFLKQEVASFPDADIGAAARVVHEGCRKALFKCAEIESVRSEDEGAKLELEAGFDPALVKLTGNVAGSAPYRGTLLHKGWMAKGLTLPSVVDGHDPHVLMPAEVEI